ncbi:unknown [Tannerella sp. CAG:118]|nr:unknown [Tannerella sp. CAG:118]
MPVLGKILEVDTHHKCLFTEYPYRCSQQRDRPVENDGRGTCIAGLLLLAVDKMVWSASHNKSPFPGRCRLLDRKKELGRRLPQVCRRRLRDGYAVRRPAVAYSERPGIQAPDPRHGCSYPFPSCSVCRKPAV